MPTLYIVATPIGNLEDVTLRALRILRQVKLIAAEDTRKTRRLLATYDIKTPLTSYGEHNKDSKLPYLLRCLVEEDLALVSEAGTPGMSDPGYELIQAAIERDIEVVPIPGVSAPVAAVMVSGLPLNQVTFLGFLPRKKGERRRLLESVADEQHTLVFFEAPHRLLKALDDIAEILGDRRIAICREMTKVHEEVFRGTVREAIGHFPHPRGEFTLVIEGKHDQGTPKLTEDVKGQLKELRRRGVSAREAATEVSRATGVSRNELYRLWLGLS
jgi:16S rRNA (cytidine1402-2'-O)-methyltransferase